MNHAEIRHFHVFAGLGGGARGFNNARAKVGNWTAEWRCLGGVDHDPAAVRDFERLAGAPGTVLDLHDRADYEAVHGHPPPDGWREATPDDLRRAAGGERPHVVFSSSPCLPASGEVITPAGAVQISGIRRGDLVYTHRGRFKEVVAVGTELYEGEMFGLRLNGTVDLQWFTANHPVWVRRVVSNKSTGGKRALGSARFMPAGEVRKGDRVGFPVDSEIPGTAEAFIASVGDPRIVVRGGRSSGRYAKPRHRARASRRIADLSRWSLDPDLWRLLGIYLGDGYRRRDQNGVLFCVGSETGRLFSMVTQILDKLGMKWSVDRWSGSTNVKVRCQGRHLSWLCGRFGDGASNKRIPPELFNLEAPLLEALVAGYRSADGSSSPRRTPKAEGANELQARWRIASVSLGLLRDVQRCLLRMGVFGGIHLCWRGGEQVIEGRRVSTRKRWELTVRLAPKKMTTFEFQDGVAWVRVCEIQRRFAAEPVWNLQVEDDETFCVPMMATHNCKGFSALVSSSRSKAEKYQALNRLALRGMLLALTAWEDDPPEVFIFENVPGIQQRGAAFLDQIKGMLQAHGYAVAETVYCCGEVGGMGARRRRYLLLARHREKTPAMIFQPEARGLVSVGDVIGGLPVPGGPLALPCGRMHELPALQWQTWVRLALVEAGSDWRSLRRLEIRDGKVVGLGIVPTGWHHGALGVIPWGESAPVITGGARPTTGRFSVADPRTGKSFRTNYGVACWGDPLRTLTGRANPTTGEFSVQDPRPSWRSEYGQLGVVPWGEPIGAVTGQSAPGTGGFSVQDPRLSEKEGRHGTKFRVAEWGEAGGTVTGTPDVGAGAPSIADPRMTGGHYGNVFRVVRWDESGQAITGAWAPSGGAAAVADPRPNLSGRWGRSSYGVMPWDQPAGAVTSGKHDNSVSSVADPRVAEGPGASELPGQRQRGRFMIVALDGTWHRPLTTLELAYLQGLLDPGDWSPFDGDSHSGWRERIGNAVPSPAAEVIGGVIGRALLASWSEVYLQATFSDPWCRPVEAAFSVATGR